MGPIDRATATAAPRPGPQSPRLPFRLRYQTVIRSTTFMLLFVLAWEVLTRALKVAPVFMVPPSAVAVAFVRLVQNGTIYYHTYISLMEFLYGFTLAAGVGIGLGAIIGVSKPVRDYTDVFLSAVYATPIVAISPLLIMWFGLGTSSKVAVVFIVSVFSILINTATGVQSVEPSLLETARCFGTRRLHIFTKIYVPASLPFIISGLRLGLGRGLIGVVVGELFGARAGLGFMISNASQVFDTATLLVGVLLFAVMGVVGTELLKALEDHITPWRKLARSE